MSLRILMIGNDSGYLDTDAQLLREKGIRVYVSENTGIVHDMIEEVKPDVVFFNWQTPDNQSADTYHSVLDNIRFASLPVIYTLSEDDVYLVNRKRTASRDQRSLICDSMMAAIRAALLTSSGGKKRVRLNPPSSGNQPLAHRA